jgi:hypothetical protein
MKKQLLIAAVAATFASVSMADISLSGAGNMKVKSNGTSSIDLDLTVSGKFDGGSFSAKMKNMQDTTAFSDAYVATTIEGFSVKAGTVKTTLGNGTLYIATAKDLVVSTTVGGVGVTATMMPGQTDAALHISGSVAGFDVKVQNANISGSRFVTLSGDMGGVSIDVENSTAAKSYTLSTELAGASVSYTKIEGDATQDDGVFSDISAMAATDSLTGVVVKANGITLKSYQIKGDDRTNKVTMTRGNVAYTASKTGSADAVLEAKVAFTF